MKKIIVGIGLDGNRYWLVVKKREAIRLSDEFLQKDKSDEDLTEPFKDCLSTVLYENYNVFPLTIFFKENNFYRFSLTFRWQHLLELFE